MERVAESIEERHAHHLGRQRIDEDLDAVGPSDRPAVLDQHGLDRLLHRLLSVDAQKLVEASFGQSCPSERQVGLGMPEPVLR